MTAPPRKPALPRLKARAGAGASGSSRGTSPRPARTVVALILVTCLPEAVLQAADWGLIGSARWRPLAYQYGAFWAGLLDGWRPNYPGQPAAMFLSYAFLHAGALHLLGNMAMLALLGPSLVRRFGAGGFLALYAAAAVGGGAAFGLLGPEAQPMVGASGALFGLAGALGHGIWAGLRARGAALTPAWRLLAELAAINLVLWLALGGQLAWQTHLGGFLAGWAMAALLTRLRRG